MSEAEYEKSPHRHAARARRHARALHGHRWRVWAGCALLALLALVFVLVRHPAPEKSKGGLAAGAGAHPFPVEAAMAHTGDAGVWLEALGSVVPLNTVNVVSRVQGQIESVAFQEGQIVRRGAPLVTIDARPYAALVLQAQGQLERDQATLRDARINLQRFRPAYRAHAISKQQLDDQEQLVNQYEGSVKGDEGALASARVNLGFCAIDAPIDGRVGLRLVDPGNIVPANSGPAIVTLTQISPITVVFSVAEDELPKILEQVKSGHAMRVDAFDRAREKRLATGAYLTLDNQIDPATGTVRVKALFPNDDGNLFPNQFVNARLLVSTEPNSTLVPTAAIQQGTKGEFVFVIKPDQTIETRAVKTGPADKGAVAVKGVKAGERVATSNFDRLQEGMKVSVQKAVARSQESGMGETP